VSEQSDGSRQSWGMVLQIIYNLFRQRGSWPTFRTVDLRLDRQLDIEDTQAALAAMPAVYLQRPWRMTGFNDADEVRLSLRGVQACEGGSDDLELLAAFMRWLVETEQSQDPLDESDLTVTSVQFAEAIGLRLGQEAETDESSVSEGANDNSIRADPERTVDGDAEQAAVAKPTIAMPSDDAASVDPEVEENRAALIRLRVLGDLLPRFFAQASWQAWQWQYSIDRQMLRPYRHIRGVAQLLDYADQQRQKHQQRQDATGRTAYIGVGVQMPEYRAADEVSEAELQLPQDADQLDVFLTLLRPEVVVAAGAQLRNHLYDDAIFAAYRRVESYLQERARLPGTIGDQLVKQAFEQISEPIKISARSQDSQRLMELLRGAFGLLKGDRSHKDKPALPCRSTRECLRQLAHASALLDLLDRDVAVAPSLRGYHHRGDTLELWIERASAQSQVWIDDYLCEIISYQPGSLALDVTGIPSGEHDLFIVDGTRTSPVTQVWLAAEPPKKGWYRVKEVNIPLFSDSAGIQRRQSITGLRLTVLEADVQSERIVPTIKPYRVGDYVEWHYRLPSEAAPRGRSVKVLLGETWVRDRSTERPIRIWESSALFDGNPIAPAHEPRLMKITLEPEVLLMRLDEKAPIRILGHYTDGVATWSEPVHSLRVTTTNDKVAFPNGATVIAKGYGTAELRVEHDGRYGSATIQVAAHPAGTLVDLLTGLPPVTGVAWARDSLIISTRTSELWRLTRDGKYQLAAAVPTQPPVHGGTDTIAAADNGDLAIRLLGHSDVLVLDAGSDYRNSRWVKKSDAGVVMAMAWNDADLILGLDTGIIQRMYPDGLVENVTTLPQGMISITCASDGLLALTNPEDPVLWHVPYDRPEEARNLFDGHEPISANVVAWLDGHAYFADFHGGRLLRFESGHIVEVAADMQNPGEMTAAPDGTIYIAEFGRGAVKRLLAR
jgi:hypothetical protein